MSHIIRDNLFFAGYFFPTNTPPSYLAGSLVKRFYLMLRTHASDYVIFSFMVNVLFIYFGYRMIRSWLDCAGSSGGSCDCKFYPAPVRRECGKPKCAPSCSPIRCILVDPDCSW